LKSSSFDCLMILNTSVLSRMPRDCTAFLAPQCASVFDLLNFRSSLLVHIMSVKNGIERLLLFIGLGFLLEKSMI
jgi:hypothetical protein